MAISTKKLTLLDLCNKVRPLVREALENVEEFGTGIYVIEVQDPNVGRIAWARVSPTRLELTLTVPSLEGY